MTADLVRELNDAVGRGDLDALGRRLHPAVIWRHNIGVGSPEEGEYEGREAVVALYERILDPWEFMRAAPSEVREAGAGVVEVEGQLYAKHSDSTTEFATPYMQRLEFQDGLLARGEMVIGPGARL
jgi:ketosteroid isomerase-like protein